MIWRRECRGRFLQRGWSVLARATCCSPGAVGRGQDVCAKMEHGTALPFQPSGLAPNLGRSVTTHGLDVRGSVKGPALNSPVSRRKVNVAARPRSWAL